MIDAKTIIQKSPRHETQSGRDVGPWARVWLTTGAAETRAWLVNGSHQELSVEIGTSSSASWQVSAANVAPTHVRLSWDGQRLWASAVQPATLNERPLHDWQPLHGQSHIRFGAATLYIESSAGGPLRNSSMPSSLAALAGTGQLDGEATVIVSDVSHMLPVTPRPHEPSFFGQGSTPQLPTIQESERFPAIKTPSFAAPPMRSEASKGVGKTSMPARTWLLLGVTCVAASAVLMLGKPQAPAAKQKASASAKQIKGDKSAAQPSAAMQGSGGPKSTGEASADRVEHLPPDLGQGMPAVAAQAADGGNDTVVVRPKLSESEQVSATEADAVTEMVAGRYDQAMALYDELQRQHPENPAFAKALKILQRRAKRCAGGARVCSDP